MNVKSIRLSNRADSKLAERKTIKGIKKKQQKKECEMT